MSYSVIIVYNINTYFIFVTIRIVMENVLDVRNIWFWHVICIMHSAFWILNCANKAPNEMKAVTWKDLKHRRSLLLLEQCHPLDDGGQYTCVILAPDIYNTPCWIVFRFKMSDAVVKYTEGILGQHERGFLIPHSKRNAAPSNSELLQWRSHSSIDLFRDLLHHLITHTARTPRTDVIKMPLSGDTLAFDPENTWFRRSRFGACQIL